MILALGLVVLAIRQLNRPETAERLGQLFGSADTAIPDENSPVTEFESLTSRQQEEISFADEEGEAPSRPADASEIDSSDDTDPLLKIRDNTYFRPDETDAWFGMWQQLQSVSGDQVRDASLGELTYAQLLKQPDYYRGKVVEVRGTVRRQEQLKAPNNTVDIHSYHRLIVEPVGGGNWPIVVYCLELPEDFPRGDELAAPVTATGYFFKNWSYAWSEGLGIAPVVLAKGVTWNQPITTIRGRSNSTQPSALQAVLIATACATLVVYVALRNTRRPRRIAHEVQIPSADTPTETVHQQLERLAQAESEP